MVSILSRAVILFNDNEMHIVSPGPFFCLLFGVSSVCARPITGHVTSVTWPVIGWAWSELTLSMWQKTGPWPVNEQYNRDDSPPEWITCREELDSPPEWIICREELDSPPKWIICREKELDMWWKIMISIGRYHDEINPEVYSKTRHQIYDNVQPNLWKNIFKEIHKW